MKQKTKKSNYNPEQQLGFLTWQLSNLWQRHVRAVLGPLGLTYIEFLLLNSTYYFKSVGKTPTQAQLSNYTGLHKMIVSKTLRFLEDGGLVIRKAKPFDKRALQLHITEDGERILNETAPTLEALETEFFKMPSLEKEGFEMSVLNLLVRNQKVAEENED